MLQTLVTRSHKVLNFKSENQDCKSKHRDEEHAQYCWDWFVHHQLFENEPIARLYISLIAYLSYEPRFVLALIQKCLEHKKES